MSSNEIGEKPGARRLVQAWLDLIRAGGSSDEVQRAWALVQACDLNGRDLAGFNFVPSVPPNFFTGANFSLAGLNGTNMGWCTLTGLELDRAELSDAQFIGAKMAGCRLDYANGIGARFNRASLVNASMVGSWFSRASFNKTDLTRAMMADVYMSEATFVRATLVEARLSGDFTGANFTAADMRGADLRGIAWPGALLAGADLTGANVEGVDFGSVRMDSRTKLPRTELLLSTGNGTSMTIDPALLQAGSIQTLTLGITATPAEGRDAMGVQEDRNGTGTDRFRGVRGVYRPVGGVALRDPSARERLFVIGWPEDSTNPDGRCVLFQLQDAPDSGDGSPKYRIKEGKFLETGGVERAVQVTIDAATAWLGARTGGEYWINEETRKLPALTVDWKMPDGVGMWRLPDIFWYPVSQAVRRTLEDPLQDNTLLVKQVIKRVLQPYQQTWSVANKPLRREPAVGRGLPLPAAAYSTQPREGGNFGQTVTVKAEQLPPQGVMLLNSIGEYYADEGIRAMIDRVRGSYRPIGGVYLKAADSNDPMMYVIGWPVGSVDPLGPCAVFLFLPAIRGDRWRIAQVWAIETGGLPAALTRVELGAIGAMQAGGEYTLAEPVRVDLPTPAIDKGGIGYTWSLPPDFWRPASDSVIERMQGRIDWSARILLEERVQESDLVQYWQRIRERAIDVNAQRIRERAIEVNALPEAPPAPASYRPVMACALRDEKRNAELMYVIGWPLESTDPNGPCALFQLRRPDPKGRKAGKDTEYKIARMLPIETGGAVAAAQEAMTALEEALTPSPEREYALWLPPVSARIPELVTSGYARVWWSLGSDVFRVMTNLLSRDDIGARVARRLIETSITENLVAYRTYKGSSWLARNPMKEPERAWMVDEDPANRTEQKGASLMENPAFLYGDVTTMTIGTANATTSFLTYEHTANTNVGQAASVFYDARQKLAEPAAWLEARLGEEYQLFVKMEPAQPVTLPARALSPSRMAALARLSGYIDTGKHKGYVLVARPGYVPADHARLYYRDDAGAGRQLWLNERYFKALSAESTVSFWPRIRLKSINGMLVAGSTGRRTVTGHIVMDAGEMIADGDWSIGMPASTVRVGGVRLAVAELCAAAQQNTISLRPYAGMGDTFTLDGRRLSVYLVPGVGMQWARDYPHIPMPPPSADDYLCWEWSTGTLVPVNSQAVKEFATDWCLEPWNNDDKSEGFARLRQSVATWLALPVVNGVGVQRWPDYGECDSAPAEPIIVPASDEGW